VENYTAHRIRTEIVAPLLDLLGQFNEHAKNLETAAKAGEIPRDYLPLNDGEPLKGIKLLGKLSREIRDKLQGAKDGLRVWREQELADKAKKYAEKNPPKNKRKPKNVD